MIAQFLGLERRTARGGRDSIDHGPGGRDDVANTVAGALVFLTSTRHQMPTGPISGTYGAGGTWRGFDERPKQSALQCEAATWSAPCTIL